MVHAKNYETVSTFVEVMQRKLWPLFFRTQCRPIVIIIKLAFVLPVVIVYLFY